MTERVGYGGAHYDYDEDDPDYNTVSLAEQLRYRDPDYEEDYTGDADTDYVEDHRNFEPELGEPHLEYNEDHGTENDFDAQFGWRSKARRSQRGRFVPPDTRTHLGAVFVRLTEL